MYAIVVGCGRLGSRLAQILSAQKHDVAVVEADAWLLSRLGNSFDGLEVVGTPIDEDVLRRAGIDRADAVIAVTADDNVNVTVAQIAKTIHNVPTVLARISDPEREGFYRQLGLSTVCPTNTGVDQIIAMLAGTAMDLEQSIQRDSRILPIAALDSWVGRRLDAIHLPKGVRIGGLVRRNHVITDVKNTIDAGDSVILLLQ